MATTIGVGATCRIGKGKTLWEVIKITGGELRLSALGKGGYVNRNANTADVNDVQEQAMQWPLYIVLDERARAKAAAVDLLDRLRFVDGDSIRDRLWRADAAAQSYAYACDHHSKELADMGIEESW